MKTTSGKGTTTSTPRAMTDRRRQFGPGPLAVVIPAISFRLRRAQ